MAITVTEFSPPAVAPAATPAPPGYTRAYASTTVQVSLQGVLRPAARAQWRPFDPGTDNQYTGALFGSPDGEVPLSFPQRADETGTIRVWAPEPVRIEIGAWLDSYAPVRQVIDLLFTEDLQAGIDLAAHAVAQNAHPTSPDEGNVLEWRPNGLFVPEGAVPPEYLTETEGDDRYPLKTDADPYPQYYNQTAGDALAQRVTDLEAQVSALDTRLATLESQVTALQDQMARHLHQAGDWDYLAGAMTMPEDIP